MTNRTPTLMAVHAHPDDEASSTGGTLAKYSAEGVQTVLVTCTNGELGDAPGGIKPDHGSHDRESVVGIRKSELEESCRLLGVNHLELLGYRDSGLMGWPENNLPGAFWTTEVSEAAQPLAGLMERYQPDVVLTYDDFGFYGHPDHIQAHRITLEAIDQAGLNPRIFFPTIRRSLLPGFLELVEKAGMEPPEFDEERFGAVDEDIAATIDCGAYADKKLAALKAHASQMENIFFLNFEFADFVQLFGTEEFICFRDPSNQPRPMDDLLSGLR